MMLAAIMRLLVVASLSFFALLSLPLRAEDCPPGAKFLRSERIGDEERTYCQCQDGHVARAGQCILKLPVVDPSFFATPSHTAFIESELARLRARKERLEKQIQQLNELREREDRYLQEMGEMREQLVYDAVGDLIAVVTTQEFLARVPGLSPQGAQEFSTSMRALRAAVDGVAYAQAGPDRERARQKALNVAATSLGLIANILPAASQEDREALAAAIRISVESVRAVAPSEKKDSAPVQEQVRKGLDRLAGIAGAAYRPVGAARAAVNAVGAGIVIWNIQVDKESIVDALVSSQRAKLAADHRLATTQEMIGFYEIELKKTGK
jgi:hypothetical protein